ncbi:hypothetical protein A9Q83_09915 [Alphaproteobacteria bacterium 46_93_T64]|nr:hypothetical protein A9Q83_09915 [Alphaproteobacteria bacterium 46_93_T64]
MRKNIFQRTWFKLALIGTVLSALVLWQTAYWSRLITLDQIGERSQHTLSLIVQALQGDLSKYRYLPQMLGENERFKGLLRGTPTETEIENASVELSRLSTISGALDTYLMDSTGKTVAASTRTFIGKNFSYRPYFKAAMDGRLGRYFALGTTSGERGYYFAYPVRDNKKILGVFVVKIQVGRHEKSWQDQDGEVIVVDKAGVIFLSSEPKWQFQTLSPLSKEVKTKFRESKQYQNKPLNPLSISSAEAEFSGGNIITITTEKDRGQRLKEQFLIEEEYMADAELRILLLASTKDVGARVRASVATAAIFLISLIFAATAMNERRKRLADRIALQEESNTQLERRVLERTNDLTNVNIELKNEVSERKRAEEEVRRTQVTLVQTAKLAALGQMSAGLSHELNQPLAAIRSYADNAREFLDRKRHDTAKQNLKGISELTERMARIIRNLRTYAREEVIEIRSTSLKSAMDESLLLMDQRIRGEGIAIINTISVDDIAVMGGDVRLQQVFVNLISNALDALEDAPVKEIHISAGFEDEDVIIKIRDTGAGIAEDQIINVFDPFYSSKEVGQGMGLGLSITHALIDQFGGSIAVHNDPRGGANFTLRLKQANFAKKALG